METNLDLSSLSSRSFIKDFSISSLVRLAKVMSRMKAVKECFLPLRIGIMLSSIETLHLDLRIAGDFNPLIEHRPYTVFRYFFIPFSWDV